MYIFFIIFTIFTLETPSSEQLTSAKITYFDDSVFNGRKVLSPPVPAIVVFKLDYFLYTLLPVPVKLCFNVFLSEMTGTLRMQNSLKCYVIKSLYDVFCGESMDFFKSIKVLSV